MWRGLLLCVGGVMACLKLAGGAALPSRAIRKNQPEKHRAKRAIPPFLADAAMDVGGKVVDKLGDRVAEAVLVDHSDKVASSLEEYFSGQFDKADEEFANVRARGGDLLSGVGADFEEATLKVIHGRGSNTGDTFSPPDEEVSVEFEHADDSDDEGGDSDVAPVGYPNGLGPVMMNGCFGNNYQEGDPCYEAFVPIEACANIIDGATFLGVGFDGRGEYSTDSRKKSLVQRACNGLQGYKEYHVPDQMTVQGIYDTDVETYTFSSMDEYRSYLEDKSAVTSATSMFFQEMNKVQGHMSVGGPFGLGAAAGGGHGSNDGTDFETTNFNAMSTASSQLSQSSTRTFLATLELNVFRYEIFLDFVTPEDLNLAFLRDFLALPTTYFAIGADRKFQIFILRWGTHYITSAKFGGQLKIIKSKTTSSEDSIEQFALSSQSDFKQRFSTFSSQQTQVKSSSLWHSSDFTHEDDSSTGFSNEESSSRQKNNEQESRAQEEYSSEMLIVQGGNQRIAAAITELYTTSFGSELKDWLDSIEEYPKAFEFTMELVTDLFDINFDELFPNGVLDYGCFGSKELLVDEKGRKYYVEDTVEANSTLEKASIRYCNFEARQNLVDSVNNRRSALERAITVYLEEGPFVSSDFSIPAGEPGCETADLAFADDSNSGVPTWQDMTNGDEFIIHIDMPYNIPRFLKAKASLHVMFLQGRWLTITDRLHPHIYDGHKNGGSGDTATHKVSVRGLVMTYDEDTGLFTVTQEDFEASAQLIHGLPDWIIDRDVGRAEYSSLVKKINHHRRLNRGDMPCNLKWSNSHRIDPTRGGRCIHFTAASEGDIFVVFAGIPRDHETWVFVEISPDGVTLYKAMRLVVTQLEQGAKGLGTAHLYQSYFVCITENREAGTTVIQFGKTPDNEERAHVWLDYQYDEILALHYYAFGSGPHPVKVMRVSQVDQPPEDFIVCREGTVKHGGRCVQRCHEECEGCRTTGSVDPRDCMACVNMRVPFPYMDGAVGDFECVAACPSTMTAPAGSLNCECIKRMDEITEEGVVTCVAECPLTHYDDNNICRICSSFCEDVSGSGVRVCTGPDVDQCHSCLYRAPDGTCMSGCNPGQQAVGGIDASAASTFTCEACPDGHRCVIGDEVAEICPAGMYSRADGTACDPCPPGQFSTSDGSSTCQQCPVAQFGPGSGSSSCESCPANTFSHSTGATSCQPCPAGSASPAGSSTCTNINECSSNPCQNGGTCNDETNRYSCTCRPGYGGYNCQTDIDECASNPCQNEGNCVDGVNRFTCECQDHHMGVLCDKAIRLVGGRENEGRVEVLHDEQWGTVCDDSWDINDAHVVCRMLGFTGAHQATTLASFGRGSGSIWLDNVACSGNEAKLDNCNHNGWGQHNCGHHEDAGVICNAAECPNPPRPTSGRVNCDAPYTTGKVCTYTCNSGYFVSSGSRRRTCNSGGSWSGSNVVCSRQTCYWLGTSPFCDPDGCGSDIQVATDDCGDGGCCWTGNKIKCCNGL